MPTLAQTAPKYNPPCPQEAGQPPGDPLSEALHLAACGFSVIPVHPGTKKPVVRWKPWQTKCPGPALLRKWWGENPRSGVGIVTGQVSGVLVLDVDPRNGGLESVSGKALPLTPTVQTPSGGFHYYFTLPQGKALGSRTGLLPGVDVKAEGGFVVAPPSRREEGAYTWIVTPEEADFADPPAWLLKLLEEAPAAGAPADRPPLDLPPGELPPGVAEGKRNDTAARLVGLWLAQGLPAAEVWARAWAWNAKNDPPLEEAELWRVLGSISRAEARKPPGARGVKIGRGLLRAPVSWPAKVLGAVLAALAQTGQPRPRTPELAALLGVTTWAVKRWRQELKAAGLWGTLEERPRKRFCVISLALLTDPTLPVRVKATALALAAAATDGRAQVGLEALAHRRGLRRQAVGDHLAALEAAGYVVTDRAQFVQALGRRERHNCYTLVEKAAGTEKRSVQAALRAGTGMTAYIEKPGVKAPRPAATTPREATGVARERTYSEAVCVSASASGIMDTPAVAARAPRREVTPPEVEISPAILAILAYPQALKLIQTHGEAAVLAYVKDRPPPKGRQKYAS